MHIIFGNDQANILKEKYVVLELDTFKFSPSGLTAIAYAVVEHVVIAELAMIETLNKLHTDLMINYRKKDWNFCDQAIEQLVGKWNGELDSFYIELQRRISTYKETDPGENWDYLIHRPD